MKSTKKQLKTTINNITIAIPGEMRLGQSIVNAVSYLSRKNPAINDDPLTALYYMDDSTLGRAIDDSHQPSGFTITE